LARNEPSSTAPTCEQRLSARYAAETGPPVVTVIFRIRYRLAGINIVTTDNSRQQALSSGWCCRAECGLDRWTTFGEIAVACPRQQREIGETTRRRDSLDAAVEFFVREPVDGESTAGGLTRVDAFLVIGIT